MYTALVIEHFSNPRNVGEIEDANGVGTVDSPTSNDIFNIYVKITDNRVIDVKFKTFGCAAAIASSSILTELVKGKTIEQALALSRNDVAEALGGLPPVKMECSTFAVDALHAALKNYSSR